MMAMMIMMITMAMMIMMILAMMTITTQVTASSFRATDTLISKEARLVVRGRNRENTTDTQTQIHRLRRTDSYIQIQTHTLTCLIKEWLSEI